MQNYGIAVVQDGTRYKGRIVPVYPAAESGTLERGSRPYTVIDILREVFGQDFYTVIQTYMDRFPEDAQKAAGADNARDFKLKLINQPKVESTLDQPACTTAVDLIFSTVVDAMVPTFEGNLEKRSYNASFRVRYLLGLWNAICSAPMIAPLHIFPQDKITEQKTAITNQYLLPVMYASEYVKAAKRMLKQYCPEALEKPTAVDGMALAGEMHLTVKLVRFPEGSDIQGRIYFDRGEVKIRDAQGKVSDEHVEPMTILINQDLCRTPEVVNSTIVHECCHVYLDLRFFQLQMLSGRPFSSYTSRKRIKKPYSQNNTAIDWMELQAEKLSAYILMEEENTKRKIEELLAIRGGTRSPGNINWVILELAKFYHVSRSMAKYRMIELGYTEAEGVYAYVENRRIPDYGCAGTWEEGITYAISLPEAGALIRNSKAFAAELSSGLYTYVEGHFCLDTDQYVDYDYMGEKQLTGYARCHIDECCIAFRVNGRCGNASYEDARAARKSEVKDKYQSRHSMAAEPDSKNRLTENSKFTDDSLLWLELKSKLPDDIGDAVKKILEVKGITQEELAMRLGVSRATWRKWCTGRMSLKHIVAICIALDVRADIGFELVRRSGNWFRNSKEQNLLLAMMYETKDLSVARANEIMVQEKLTPLTENEGDDLSSVI